MSQVLTCASDTLALNLGFLCFPPQVLSHARTAHRIQENTDLHLLVYYIMWNMIKDIDDQPDEETHRANSRGVLITGVPVSR